MQKAAAGMQRPFDCLTFLRLRFGEDEVAQAFLEEFVAAG
jgi:hypothetical protein